MMSLGQLHAANLAATRREEERQAKERAEQKAREEETSARIRGEKGRSLPDVRR